MSEDALTAENTIVSSMEPDKKFKSLWQVIVASILLVLIIALAAYAYTLNNKVNVLIKKNVELSQNIDNQFNQINPKIKDIDTIRNDVNAAKTATKLLSTMVLFSSLGHEIENGVVTDDFYVKKVMFDQSQDGKLSALIDIDTQPDMYLKYQGKGVFTIPDRELRTKATAILDAVKDYYNKNSTDTLPKWDNNANISLTIKNYNIGKVKNGEFVLSGEK